MYKKLTTLLSALLCCLLAGAQPLANRIHYRGNHHTHRLPGVNERRLERLEKMRQANAILRHRQGPWRAQTQPQTKKGLVLLVDFSDTKMKDDAHTYWNNCFNQSGFSQFGHVGSVRDYFIEQSYGLLTIDFDVVGPLSLTQTRTYYGTAPYGTRLNDRAAEMVIEALKLANSQVNYADYDWYGNGEVDQIYVIYAGETYPDRQGYIWPHEWSLSSAQYYGCGSGYQHLDGVYIDTYAVSNELASATTLTGIGTACHEFSHCLGFPDFYDTNYEGGTAGQNWDLLDGGSYNGPEMIGEVPSPYTAYERWAAGWIDLIPLTEPTRVTDMPAINEEGKAYVIRNTGNSNEYYILENRQQKTFGTYNRGHGLMVWHIDYNQSLWKSNNVNTDKNHQRMTFLPADGSVGELRQSNGYYFYYIAPDDEAGDPYPGLQKVKSVQQLTWFTKEKNGTNTHQNLIHDIAETSDGKISFTYGNYIDLTAPELAAPTDMSADGFTANWLAVNDATSYTLQVEFLNGQDAPASVLTENFSGFQSAGANTIVGNSVINKYTQTSGWSVSNLYGTGDAFVRVGSTTALSSYIMTPAVGNKAGTLLVEFDAAYHGTENSSAVVSVVNGNQTTIATQTVALTGTRATYRCTFENIPSGCMVKFAATAVKKRFYLYNVNIMDMSGTGRKTITVEGITATSYRVAPIEAEQYYYRVRAVGSDGPSEWSEWMGVNLADAIVDISATNSFTDDNDRIYDLIGRRLQRAPQRGIYIRNGKTYIAR